MDDYPGKIDLDLGRPFYKGSVQNLYNVPGHPELLLSETTAGGSVFDVGTIFNIEGSDTGRAGFRHLVFQTLKDPGAWKALSDEIASGSPVIQKDGSGIVAEVLREFKEKGAPTHHVGMVDAESGEVYSSGFPPRLSNLTLIKKYEVIKPGLEKVLGWHFYDYSGYRDKAKNVVPLEYIVRLGVTSGSSILKKYKRLSESDRAAYLNELGVEGLRPWTRFDTPVVDLTTKYEPEDRNLSRQEASLISCLDGGAFSRSMVMAVLGAFMLQHIFRRMGLSLWDLKWEIARDGKDLVFVDTIDTDSVRVTFDMERDNRCYFVHFNKQAMRDYYRIMQSEWYDAVNNAKKIAEHAGRPFTEILSEGQISGEYPSNPVIDEDFLNIQKEKFLMIQSFIQDGNQDLKKESERIAGLELDYYLASNRKKEYEDLNSV